QRGERHRDVDTADLVGDDTRGRLVGCGSRPVAGRRFGLVVAPADRARPERDPGSEREQYSERHCAPDADLTPAPTAALAVARIEIGLSHRKPHKHMASLDSARGPLRPD